MKRMKCMIVFLLVAGLAVSAPKSNAMSKKVKKQYTKVLQKYVGKGNDEYSIPKFALVDIDQNGIPELMIQKDGQITGEMLYYTCKKSNKKLVKIKGPSSKDNYPCFGGLSRMPSRKSYAFYRGGPGYTDDNGNGIMPYLYAEYKIKKNRIVCVSLVNKKEYMDKNKVEYSGTYLGKKKVTKADYNRIEKACRGEIKFKNITNKNIAKIYFACRERSRKVSSQCELYSDGSGVYFLHRRKVLFLLLSTERKKSVGRISPSERISGEMCRLSG